jgi:phosphatidylserine/phosphatidylglycerophosphate/cardiolipin synthase-like enzyme
MLVDDAWATIGSTNVADRSFRSDTELNASIWHGDVVRKLREALFEEHLAEDTSALDVSAAFERFHRRAHRNALRKLAGAPLEGLAFRLDAGLYGLGPPVSW